MLTDKSNFVKIAGAAVAAGTVAAIGTGLMNKGGFSSKMKKFAKKSSKALDDMFDSIQYMFK